MKNINYKAGFTLIELLVSISIFSIILVMTIANFHTGNQSSELRLKALEVSENIRRVQNNALVALPNGGTIPDRYGIHFASGSAEYIIFADSAISGQPFLYDAPGEVLEKISLGTNFVIAGMNSPQIMNKTVDPSVCYTVRANVMDIVFDVPSGKIYFNGVQPLGRGESGNPDYCGEYNPGRIEIFQKKSGQSAIVMINWISGQISTTEY